MVKIVADRALQLAKLTELLVVIFRLCNFDFYQLVNVIGVSGSLGTTDHQLECVKVVINVVDKMIQIIRDKSRLCAAFVLWNQIIVSLLCFLKLFH